jgi:hypothetical protein
MKYIAIVFLLYAFLKNIYYGIYEFKNEKNKSGGIAIILIAIIGFILPVIFLMIYY